jgi:hypothetical protein
MHKISAREIGSRTRRLTMMIDLKVEGPVQVERDLIIFEN